jgi:hypothetical protein
VSHRRGVALAALLATALLLPASADARVHRIAGVVPDLPSGALHHVRGPGTGLRSSSRVWSGVPTFGVRAHMATALPYHGGPVLHSNRTHLLFWQPAGSGLTFEAGYTQLIAAFMSNVASDSHLPSNVYGLSGQYTDSAGTAAYDSTYVGSTVVSDPLPANGCTLPAAPPLNTGPGWSVCLTDVQMQAEVEQAVTANGLPRGATDIYFLVTPDGLGSCTPNAAGNDRGPDSCSLGGSGPDSRNPYQGSYCGYHSQTQTGLLYSVIPYNNIAQHCQSGNPKPNQNAADPTISTLSHEHNETVTDPLGDAWITNDGSEDGDLCALYFGDPIGGTGQTAWNEQIGLGHYFLQEEWSNEDGTTPDTACQPRDESDSVTANVSRRVQGDRTVRFSGTAHDPDGSIALYEWFFGDGKHVYHSKVTHAYTRAATFNVVLATVNSASNFSFARKSVTVIRPPAPLARVAGGPGSSTASRRPRFRFASDAAIATFSCRVDAGAWRACSSPWTSPRLASGPHTVSVRARDTFGQSSRRAASYAFAVR